MYQVGSLSPNCFLFYDSSSEQTIFVEAFVLHTTAHPLDGSAEFYFEFYNIFTFGGLSDISRKDPFSRGWGFGDRLSHKES
jgi:hypothetical protein